MILICIMICSNTVDHSKFVFTTVLLKNYGYYVVKPWYIFVMVVMKVTRVNL